MNALSIGDRVRSTVNTQGLAIGRLYIVEEFTADGQFTALRLFGTNRLIAVREAEACVVMENRGAARATELPERCACGLFCMAGGERREAPPTYPPGARSDHHPDGCAAYFTTGDCCARHDRGAQAWRKIGDGR